MPDVEIEGPDGAPIAIEMPEGYDDNMLNTAARAVFGGMQEAVKRTSLVERVIKQESAGKVDAVSPKGALGLMQLMPATAKYIAKKIGLPFDKERLTKDKEYNEKLGTAYLNEQLQDFDNHEILALAAYNAGPTKVNQWIKSIGDPRTGEISDEDFISQIPFDETKDYVTKITQQ